MDQPYNFTLTMQERRVREQNEELLAIDAAKRRLLVAAIVDEWARKTMAEYGTAAMQPPVGERE